VTYKILLVKTLPVYVRSGLHISSTAALIRITIPAKQSSSLRNLLHSPVVGLYLCQVHIFDCRTLVLTSRPFTANHNVQVNYESRISVFDTVFNESMRNAGCLNPETQCVALVFRLYTTAVCLIGIQCAYAQSESFPLQMATWMKYLVRTYAILSCTHCLRNHFVTCLSGYTNSCFEFYSVVRNKYFAKKNTTLYNWRSYKEEDVFWRRF
jgi:hypothetical protein